MTKYACGMAAALALAFGSIPPAMASGEMPAAQQIALVQKYCAVCHTDAHPNGGISLQHFDAAHADPGVAEMILSKLTSGIPLKTVTAAQTDPDAAALVADRLKTGAIGAAGIPVPDPETQVAFVRALSAEAANFSRWSLNRTEVPGTQGPMLTASIVQEAPSPIHSGDADSYRLTITCRPDTRKGEIQLAWAPGVPSQGQMMSAAVDGDKPVGYKIEGHETMSNTGKGDSGPGAIILYASGDNSEASTHLSSLPKRSLTVTNAFDNGTVVFPFGSVPETTRKALSTCFAESSTGQ
jgi:hypothetical protein